tara:strand:+ start:41 stop:310 length:270 start_codon:yes stop_codon:yes gene_type:complete
MGRDTIHVKRPVVYEPPAKVEKNMFAPLNPCKVFLANFLSGGPIARTNVYREAGNQNLEWEDVKFAFFTELKGREYMQRGEWLWKLVPL